MENKDLQYFKDEVAEENGYDHWNVLAFGRMSFSLVLELSDEAGRRYASHVAEQACKRQRELCADAAEIELIPCLDGGPLDVIEEIKDSIRNAPLATESK